MAEDTTESNNPGEPKKTPTRKRTSAAGLVLSGMTTMLEVAAQAAARAESVQKMVDSLMPFEQPTPNGMDLLVGIPAYRKLEAIEAEAAAKVDPAPPASDRGPGEHRKQDPQSVPATVDESRERRLMLYESRLRADVDNANGVSRRRLALIGLWRTNSRAINKASYETLAGMINAENELIQCAGWNVKDDLPVIEAETGIAMRERRNRLPRA